MFLFFTSNYASPSSGEAYRDRQLTTSFELKFFVCRHVSICGFQNRVCLSVHLSVPREKKSPWLRQYQSYISNWYINVKVFTSTTTWKPKNLIFFFKFEFWIVTKSWKHPCFVNISLTLVIDTSMEKSSRVLQHGNPKIWIFSKKLEFWIVMKSWNHPSFVNISPTIVANSIIQVSLMHLYDDILDASSSLRGSTSSYLLWRGLWCSFINEPIQHNR